MSYFRQRKGLVKIWLSPCPARTRDELGTSAMNVDPDLDETQQVMELATKKWEEDDVTRELRDDAARCAARKMMERMAGTDHW